MPNVGEHWMRRSWGRKKQTAYGTALADADCVAFVHPFKATAPCEESKGYESDAEERGKGHGFATEIYATEKEVSVPELEFDLSTEAFGLFGSFGLGEVATELLTAGVYKHTMRIADPAEVDFQLPQLTMLESDGELQSKVRDLVVDKITLSGALKQWVDLKVGLISAGHRADNAYAIPVAAPVHKLRMTGAALSFGVAGALVDVSRRWRNFEFSTENNHHKDDAYVPSGGDIRTECLTADNPKLALKFEIKPDGSTEIAHMRANDLLQAVLTFTGAQISGIYYHEVVLTFKCVKVMKITPDFSGGFKVLKVECEPIFDDINDITAEAFTSEDIGATVFTGTGLDDITIGGDPAEGSGDLLVRVTLATEGTPDLVNVSIDGGVTQLVSGVALTGLAQTIGTTGLTYTALATTGHTATDHWDAETGLNDITVAGTPTAHDAEYDFRVEIDLAAATDTFRWSVDGGVTWEVEDVAITGAAQTLGTTGVTITFAATTGHTLGDRWDFETESRNGPLLAEVTSAVPWYHTSP